MTYSDLMGIITTGEGADKYVQTLQSKGIKLQNLINNEPIAMFIDNIDN